MFGHMCTWVWMHTCWHVRELGVRGTVFPLCALLKQGLSKTTKQKQKFPTTTTKIKDKKPRAHIFGCLPKQLVPEIPCLCLLNAGTTGSCHPCLDFTWVLGTQTLILLLVWQKPYPWNPFPQPKSYHSSSWNSLTLSVVSIYRKIFSPSIPRAADVILWP